MLSLDELNRAEPRRFADALAPLFEGAPRFLGRLAGARPFASDEQLFSTARRIAAQMPRDEQVELLDAHPRIGAAAHSMSDLSRAEQRTDAIGASDVGVRLRELNDAYEARFGFRFVVFVAGRSREAIVSILERALRAEPEGELRRGLADVVAIAEDRLRKLRAADAPRPTIGA